MNTFINLFDRYIKPDRLTILNLILGLLIAITPDNYIAFASFSTSDTNTFANSGQPSLLLAFIALVFLFVWVADFWASPYRANILYTKRMQQEKKGLSLLLAFSFLHIVASLAIAGATGTLLGALFGGVAVFIPLFTISGLVKEGVLISKLSKIKKNPVNQQTKKKNIVSDAALLLYAYIVFIITWQSFVYSENLLIDLKRPGYIGDIILAVAIYLFFYMGACWLWFEEIFVSLKTRKQKLYFAGAFTFEVVVVVIKLIK